MKQIRLVIFLAFVLAFTEASGQQKKDSCCLSKKDIIGVWQRNDSIIGSGLGQNFQFFNNNTFVFNIGTDADDARNLIQLKGKYRLNKNMLYLTITSKTILEGKIGIADAGISLNIFSIKDEKAKEIKEPNPKEISDPCYITFFTTKHIKLSNEVYYKVQ